MQNAIHLMYITYITYITYICIVVCLMSTYYTIVLCGLCSCVLKQFLVYNESVGCWVIEGGKLENEI